MPRYYFDLHAGSLSEWDDDGRDADNADAAVSLANNMLRLALANNRRLQGDRHAVVVIRDRSGHQIATATGRLNGHAYVNRMPPVSELS